MAPRTGLPPLDPPVMLAPMAGITDRPFRDLVQRFGVGLVTSEMVASHDILNNRPGSREKTELGLETGGTAVQLAGRAPAPMAEAARMVADQGACIIDINMGCPAKKVVGGLSGSALMRDLDLALSLIDAVVGAVDIPVTLKTRLGWDDGTHNAPELARRAEAAGVARLVIHGRTRCQFYKGRAAWAAVRAVKDAVGIPVFVNGDITDVASAREALRLSGADGIMIGRGAQGRPWALADIAAGLYGTPAPVLPRGADLADLVAAHYDATLGLYGRDLGLRVARKHLGWFMDGTGAPRALRQRVLTSRDPAEVVTLLPEAMATIHTESAAA